MHPNTVSTKLFGKGLTADFAKICLPVLAITKPPAMAAAVCDALVESTEGRVVQVVGSDDQNRADGARNPMSAVWVRQSWLMLQRLSSEVCSVKVVSSVLRRKVVNRVFLYPRHSKPKSVMTNSTVTQI